MKNEQEKELMGSGGESKIKIALFSLAFFILGAFFGMFIFSADTSTEPQLPQAQIINRNEADYMYSYDGKTKNPSWVLEFLARGEVVSKQPKTEFIVDKSIPISIRTKLSDYEGSGFDIAHLLTVSEQGILNTRFPLSTASPQLPQFNQGYWTKVNDHVREFIKQLWADQVAVATGPLFLPQQDKDGKKYVTYQVIGENNIAVPTHFFKAVFYPSETPGKDQTVVGSEIYIIPNEEIREDTPLDSFKASLEKLQEVSGIIFPEDMMPYITRKLPPPRQ